MNQLQFPKTTRQSSLICTQILRKYTSPSKTPNQKIKTITYSTNKIDQKEERKIQYQLTVKGKTMNRQAYEQKGKQKKVRSVSKRQQRKQEHFWLGTAAISSPSCIPLKQNQNLLSTLQVSKHTQILTFYHSNVFACHNQHNRFNKILRKKYCNPTSKTQYYPQQSQESFSQAHRNLSLKNDLNKTSKIEVRRSSLLFPNQTKGSQLFEPRLKYKKRPKSVDNNKKYKMNSLFVKLRKNSIAEVDKNMNVEHAHIEPLKYQDQTQPQMTFDDQKIVTLKQPPSIPLQQSRRNVNIIIKTQPSPPRIKSRSKQKETILTSSRGINPWSDQQWRAKNIFDEQINVKLLS